MPALEADLFNAGHGGQWAVPFVHLHVHLPLMLTGVRAQPYMVAEQDGQTHGGRADRAARGRGRGGRLYSEGQIHI